MKKFITITSILAAGTLFANATTTLTLEILECDRATQKAGKISGSNFDHASISAVANYVLTFGTGNYGGGMSGSSASAISNWNSNTDGKVAKGSDNSYTITLLGRIGVSGEWFTSILDFDSSNVSSGDYVSALTLDFTAPTNGAVSAILIVKYNDNTVVTSDSKTSATASSSANVVLELTETEKAISQVAFVLYGPSGGATTAYDVTNLTWGATISAIPEPSMFGLLAGTLALGLAGTRRRRK